MMRNVRPFREEPSWLWKIGVATLYLVLGWLLTIPGPAAVGDLLWTFLIVGIIAWAVVLRRKTINYFGRYHIIQALVLNLVVGAIIWVLAAVIQVLVAMPLLGPVGEYIYMALFAPMLVGGVWAISAKDIVVLAIAAVMAVYCLRGRYTELPWISDTVRNWV